MVLGELENLSQSSCFYLHLVMARLDFFSVQNFSRIMLEEASHILGEIFGVKDEKIFRNKF